ncbi:MAG: glycosyltransferase [Akkermansiaceae bacterium]
MKITAVIDNYNSEKYVREAIASVLSQSRLPDELIIVDDGSEDGAVEVIKKAIEGVTYARLIEQENGGQLKCLTTGILAAQGDIIALLDGDDLWKPNHLENAQKKFIEYPELALYFCDYETIGANRKGVLRFANVHFRSTMALTTLSEAFIGNVTATLVFRSSILQPYLPLPVQLEREWKINADNVLVWLSCMSGREKYSSSEKNVLYRVHENNMHKTSLSAHAKARKRLATKRLFEYFRREFYIPLDIHKCLLREYKAHDETCKSVLKMYRKAVRNSHPQSSLIERLIMRIGFFR